ncbi:hypothetical protein DV737_g2021, partial [Chaetothyriales sp. CBS 132003]
MAQRHTEESLLTGYLLPPSSLPTIIPFSTFVNYHKPGASNSNSSASASINPATAQALKKFYRDLQFQRQIDVDTRALDATFFGPNGAVLPARSRRYHTTASLLAAMESSIHDLEREIADLDQQSDKILGEMHETVGELSDLRYGKSGGEYRGVEAEVVDALKEFTNVVKQTAKEAKSVL